MNAAPLPCLAEFQAPRGPSQGWLPKAVAPLPGLDDEEGPRLPSSLPPVVDAHVHIFPDRVFEAIWRWFDAHGWPVRYRLPAPEVARFLLSRGVERVVALHYAHRPGMARALNQFMASVCADEPRIVGLATVLPGEEGAGAILDEAFAMGLRGVKMHCHVQCFAPDDAAMQDVYAACVRADLPLVMHAGREPKSPAYKCDPHALCSAERVARVLQDHPRLRLCVPHLGADEFEAYEHLLERHDTLWLDTTMVAADYFPVDLPVRLLRCRPDRVLYGTDFPNIPYAWDREIKRLAALGLPEEDLAALLGQNAMRLFAIEAPAPTPGA
ncbi:amidohydrolase family protein [Chondromyces apiculatus]|uniref:Amidohydrolase family protein n=1 Tax=Chondromyces apiculatus DSM 436 TaxID=1192034 RepID=A0A017TBM2_9BACT|nr:amidohydrolase family protein [Chondromyces apiculatus]EYF06322.1 amidohydrolase family protein [Chondromyces apiculatus DSM 436]